MEKPKISEKIIIAETKKLPFIQKHVRLYFDPTELMNALKEKSNQHSENVIFYDALYDYAIAALGKAEVERCLKKKI